MSSIKLSPASTGSAIFTIEAPATSTNRTLTLPDATGTVQVSGNPISGTTASFSGDVTLGSSVLATPSGSAPSYLCRAWVNFNGTGTVAIRASGNVSSITDNGTGNYTVNFTTAMPDVNYICLYTGGDTAIAAALPIGYITTTTTAAQTIRTYNYSTGVLFDSPNINIAIFR